LALLSFKRQIARVEAVVQVCETNGPRTRSVCVCKNKLVVYVSSLFKQWFCPSFVLLK